METSGMWGDRREGVVCGKKTVKTEAGGNIRTTFDLK